MIPFSKKEVKDKLKSRSVVQSNGCWFKKENLYPAATMINFDGSYYQRTLRQFSYFVATGVDTYKIGKKIGKPMCGNGKCLNPDHQRLQLIDFTTNIKPVIRSHTPKNVKLGTHGEVVWWH